MSRYFGKNSLKEKPWIEMSRKIEITWLILWLSCQVDLSCYVSKCLFSTSFETRIPKCLYVMPKWPKNRLFPNMVMLYRRKAFLMLISDFEFMLPDFDIWGPGEGGGPNWNSPNIVMLYIIGNHFEFLFPGERVNYYINHILVYNRCKQRSYDHTTSS